MASIEALLAARHIQNMSAAAMLEPHWGYADRALPCTGDSCAYLDLVYIAHDRSMLYSGIMYALVGGLLFGWAVGRRLWSRPQADAIINNTDAEKTTTANEAPRTTISRMQNTIAALSRKYLLPDSVRAIFGRTTRLQVLVLAVISSYLIIFSFAGMWYQQWTTAAKNAQPGVFTTRTTLGPWSNRVGVLAYALTPFSVILSSRESLLSLITGVPYQSFNFLHRWLGYIIVAQGVLHTVGWLIVELYLYQPQPYVPLQLFKEVYMWWGCIATFLLLVLFGLSTPWGIRVTGYEFFRKAHYVLAMVYIGAIYGHWDKLSCFLIPGLLLWGIDRFIRLFRSAMIHYNFVSADSLNQGFRAAQAEITHFSDLEHGDVVRLDFEHPQEPWKVGQHFYLTFTESSIWQSHPFTPLSLPSTTRELNSESEKTITTTSTVRHSYVLRAKGGETKKLAQLALKKMTQAGGAVAKPTTSVILSGSYGKHITANLTPENNVLCIAGGTGITYVLPVLLELVSRPAVADRKVELIWAVRRRADLEWVAPELALIQGAAQSHGIAVHVFVTREAASSSSSASSSSNDAGASDRESQSASHEEKEEQKEVSEIALKAVDVQKIGNQSARAEDRHPDLKTIVDRFQAATVSGPTTVFASGPGGMLSDLRSIVAGCNRPSEVWKGQARGDVRLIYDERLEW